MSNPVPDEIRIRALMAAYQGGDLAAFDQLYALLAPVLGRWLRARVSNASEADDLLQETFLQMHRARHTYDPDYPVTPWAYAITRHVWLMARRARSRRLQPNEQVDAIDVPVRGEAESYAARAEVHDALSSISSERRRAVIWHHVFGFSFREIAARLGIRETAAKLRSSRGVSELRTRLGRDRQDRRHE